MSAIGAIYHCDGKPVERACLLKLNQAMNYHGPDGHGIWSDGAIGLTQQITHLTAESRKESLPLVWPTQTLALVCH